MVQVEHTILRARRGHCLRGDRPAVRRAPDQPADPPHSQGGEHEITQPIGLDVADLVLQEVERTGAELLVVGLRHRTPVGKLIMGSVSQRLLLDCPVPVFAVRPARD
jgi:nucleotide-binding universal stress UspA family protein